VGLQLLRAATSAGSNYRAACHARSRREFIAKLRLVLEEADECDYWLRILERGKIIGEGQDGGLRREAQELCAIFAAPLRTARTGGERREPPR